MKLLTGKILLKGVNVFSSIKLALVLGFCLSLQGCFYQVVNNFDIERASKICGSVGDIVSIAAFFDGKEQVLCKNNTTYDL